MARPRAGTNLRKSVTLSLSEEAIAILDKIGPNRSAAADILILREHAPVRVATPARDERDVTTNVASLRQKLDATVPAKPMRKPRVSPQETRVPNGETPCNHPRAARTITSMGIAKCGACGKFPLS